MRTIHDLTEDELCILDHYIDMVDPNGEWEFSGRPIAHLQPVEHTVFYLKKDGIVPYMYLSQDFDDMLKGLEENGIRDKINLNDMKVLKVTLWEDTL